jgi:acetone carboxylase gamma subunit
MQPDRKQLYPAAGRRLITADCGGSNGARVRLWKLELQKLADDTGLTLRGAMAEIG